MDIKVKPDKKSHSLDNKTNRNYNRVYTLPNENTRKEIGTPSKKYNEEKMLTPQQKTLKFIMKRGAEEKMLPEIINSLKQKQNENTQINQEIQKQTKEFYNNLNVFDFKEEDFYFLFAERIYQEKKEKFHSGEEPVKYFNTILNEDQKPYARCAIDFSKNKDKKKYDFKFIRGGDKQALINNTHDDKMFSDCLEQNEQTNLKHISQHIRRPSFQLQKQTYVLDCYEQETQEDRWNRIKQKIKDNAITCLIKNARTNNSEIQDRTYTEQQEIEKQEEEIYEYLKRREKTKSRILNDPETPCSMKSIVISPDKDQQHKTKNSNRQSLQTNQRNQFGSSLCVERHSKSQPSSPQYNNDNTTKSHKGQLLNRTFASAFKYQSKKASNFKDECMETKSRRSTSPLSQRLSEFNMSYTSTFRSTQTKQKKGNTPQSNKSIFKLSQNKQIKLDKNNLELIQHFKNISNKPNEPYFFLATITRTQIEEYLNLRYPENITQRILNFMECPQTMNFRQYRKWIEIFNQWTLTDILFFCFFILDFNQDGLICQTDSFHLLRNQQTWMLERDFTQISRYVAKKMIIQNLFIINSKAIKLKYTKNVDNLIDEPLFPELCQQKNLTYMLYKKIAENEDFGERERFLKKIQEHKEKGVNLTLFSIWDQYKERFLEQKDIDEEIRLQEQSEENQRKKNIMQNGKGEIVHYFKNDRKFKLNFNQFKSIFIREKPFFFYDLIACLSLYSYQDIQYPYVIQEEFSKMCNQILQIRSKRDEKEKQEQEQKQITEDKINKYQVQKILEFYKSQGGARGAKNALKKLEMIPNINIQ